MGKQEDFVLRALEERDVRFVRLWFTDVLGQLSTQLRPVHRVRALPEGLACACGRSYRLAKPGTLERRRSAAGHDG